MGYKFNGKNRLRVKVLDSIDNNKRINLYCKPK